MPEAQAPASTPQAPQTPQPKNQPQAQPPSQNRPNPGKQEASLGDDQKPMTKAEIRRYKVKIDGQESEVDEQELIRGYQIRKAADKKFAEAAMTRKQAEDFIAKLKTPAQLKNALEDLGYDPRQLAEAYLGDQLNYELMTKEQKEAYHAKIELQRYKEQEAQRKLEEEEKETGSITERTAMELQSSIIDILDSEKLPKKPSTVWRIARQMLINLDQGIDVSPRDVVYDVAREIKQEHQDLYGDLDGEQLLQLLGEDVAKKIRSHDLSRVTNNIQQTRAPNQIQVKKSPERKFTTEREFDDYLKKIKAGK